MLQTTMTRFRLEFVAGAWKCWCSSAEQGRQRYRWFFPMVVEPDQYFHNHSLLVPSQWVLQCMTLSIKIKLTWSRPISSSDQCPRHPACHTKLSDDVQSESVGNYTATVTSPTVRLANHNAERLQGIKAWGSLTEVTIPIIISIIWNIQHRKRQQLPLEQILNCVTLPYNT